MRGFTLIEVLLAVLLIGVLASAAVPAFQSFQQRSDLAVAIDAVAQRYRRAQALSRAVSGDSPWGVHVATGSVIVFRGISFAGRNASYDELVVLGRSVIPSGLTDVVFDPLTGRPRSTGVLTLETSNGDTRFLTLNAQGTVLYD